MKNYTQDVVGYRISQLDRPFDLKPNQATMSFSNWVIHKSALKHAVTAVANVQSNT